jgi:hypothetical protein
MQFGYFYVHGTVTLYDISTETVGGHRVHVASLSENPTVRIIGATPQAAVERLKQHLLLAATALQPTWSRQFASSARAGGLPRA